MNLKDLQAISGNVFVNLSLEKFQKLMDRFDQLEEKVETSINGSKEKKYVSREKAAEICDCSIDTIDNYVKEKKLTPKRLAGKRLIRFDINEVYGLIEYEVIESRTLKGRRPKRGMKISKKA